MAKRVFTSFDFDHDENLRNLLIGQAKYPDSPFEIHDWSVKEPFGETNWQKKVREKIRRVDQVVVLCGEHTHKATGVAIELRIAREENKPYFLLRGYSGKTCTKPTSAAAGDKIYDWTWPNLKKLIGGAR